MREIVPPQEIHFDAGVLVLGGMPGALPRDGREGCDFAAGFIDWVVVGIDVFGPEVQPTRSYLFPCRVHDLIKAGVGTMPFNQGIKGIGIVDEVTITDAGINGKMSEVNAAFGLLQLNETKMVRSEPIRYLTKLISPKNEKWP